MTSTSAAEGEQFYRRMPVYAGARRIGFVAEVGHAVDYLHVRRGRFLVRDWYIPLSAVQRVTAGGVYLRESPVGPQARAWAVPPGEYLMRQGATPGYEYTSRKDNPYQTDAESAGRPES